MKIRVKMLLVILPLIAATTSITGILSATAAQKGLTRVALRLLNFKAEELAGYMRSQWDLLLENGLAADKAFVAAAQSNVASFAVGLVRSERELMLAVDSSGRIALRTRDLRLGNEVAEDLFMDQSADGWVELTLDGVPYVGFAFYFIPFTWRTFVLEERQSFLGEVRRITAYTAFVLAASIAAGAAAILAFSLYLTRPLSRVAAAIESLRGGPPAADRVPVEFPDEIGDLADHFNMMTEDLGAAYVRLKEFAFREAVARRQLDSGERETLVVLARAAERRDPETAAHINRVGLYSRLLARLVGLDELRQNLLYFAAPLHDIGKLGVPDAILLKAGGLTPEEQEQMREHTRLGYSVLKDASNPYLRAGAMIALTHHERYNGSGYPQGLVRREIPVLGQIVGLVDVLDALTSRRPYKEAWNLERAFAYLAGQRDVLFAAPFVDALLANADEVAAIRGANGE